MDSGSSDSGSSTDWTETDDECTAGSAPQVGGGGSGGTRARPEVEAGRRALRDNGTRMPAATAAAADPKAMWPLFPPGTLRAWSQRDRRRLSRLFLLCVTAVTFAYVFIGWPEAGGPGHRLHMHLGYDTAADSRTGFVADSVAPPLPRFAPDPAGEGHVPAAAWPQHGDVSHQAYEVPLATLKERRDFPRPVFGLCEPFTVPNGAVYGMVKPSSVDHVGAVIPGQVFTRCQPGWELRREFR